MATTTTSTTATATTTTYKERRKLLSYLFGHVEVLFERQLREHGDLPVEDALVNLLVKEDEVLVRPLHDPRLRQRAHLQD